MSTADDEDELLYIDHDMEEISIQVGLSRANTLEFL
jgi:hypothetical protein